jgi:hypothetical protein
MLNTRTLVLAGLISVGMAASAQASVIARTFDLTASDFIQVFGSDLTPPTDPVHLNFTLNFNNSANIGTTTTGLTVNMFDLPYSAEFQYFAATDSIALATDLTGPATCGAGHATFCTFIHNATSNAPTVNFFQNSLPTSPAFNVWRADTFAIKFADRIPVGIDGGIPEPAAWALMLIGFGGIGASLRAARRKAGAAFA